MKVSRADLLVAAPSDVSVWARSGYDSTEFHAIFRRFWRGGRGKGRCRKYMSGAIFHHEVFKHLIISMFKDQSIKKYYHFHTALLD